MEDATLGGREPALDGPAVSATTLDGIRQSEWMAGLGFGESAAYELLRISGVRGELRRVPGTKRPVRFLLPEQLAVLNPLAQRFRSGISLRQIEEDLQRLRRHISDEGASALATVQAPEGSANLPETLKDSTALTRAGSSALVAEAPPGSTGLAEVPKTSPSWAVELIAAVRGLPSQPSPAPEIDPLQLARRLKEAADLAVPLSQTELAQLVGLSARYIQDEWREDRQIRPGIWLRRQFDGRRVWWTVSREQPNGAPVTMAKPQERPTQRSMGFEDGLVGAMGSVRGRGGPALGRGPVLRVLNGSAGSP